MDHATAIKKLQLLDLIQEHDGLKREYNRWVYNEGYNLQGKYHGGNWGTKSYQPFMAQCERDPSRYHYATPCEFRKHMFDQKFLIKRRQQHDVYSAGCVLLRIF